MGPGLWGALGGAGLGMIQQGSQKKQHEHDKQVAAETARWSPWTGMAPQKVGPAPTLFGNMAQGALAGTEFATKNFGEDTTNPAKPAAALAAEPAAPQSQEEYAAASPFAAGPRQQQGNPWAMPNPYAPPGFGN